MKPLLLLINLLMELFILIRYEKDNKEDPQEDKGWLP